MNLSDTWARNYNTEALQQVTFLCTVEAKGEVFSLVLIGTLITLISHFQGRRGQLCVGNTISHHWFSIYGSNSLLLK